MKINVETHYNPDTHEKSYDGVFFKFGQRDGWEDAGVSMDRLYGAASQKVDNEGSRFTSETKAFLACVAAARKRDENPGEALG